MHFYDILIFYGIFIRREIKKEDNKKSKTMLPEVVSVDAFIIIYRIATVATKNISWQHCEK